MTCPEHIEKTRFFNAKARAWSEGVYVQRQRQCAERLLQRYRISPSGVVIDIGCGTGVLTSILTTTASIIISVDPSLEMLQMLQESNNFSRCFPVLCFAEELPFKSSSADWIVVYSAFPHFTDKSGSLMNFLRVLRPGGRVLIFHTSSRLEINKLHATLAPPLCYDLLPPIHELIKMCTTIGLHPLILEDTEQCYVFLAQKT